jgi:hypothetical protein
MVILVSWGAVLAGVQLVLYGGEVNGGYCVPAGNKERTGIAESVQRTRCHRRQRNFGFHSRKR